LVLHKCKHRCHFIRHVKLLSLIRDYLSANQIVFFWNLEFDVCLIKISQSESVIFNL
jgi:hypothetical protein